MTNWSLRFPPREWQIDAVAEWRHQMRGIVSVVTGGGKTVFAFMCMIEFFRRHPHGRVNIVVPTAALLDQWYVGLQEELGVSKSDIGVFSGLEKSDVSKTVNLMVINTARDLAATFVLPEQSFLIVDECHRAGSPINARALKGMYVASLGLSATPEREYDDGFYQYVQPALGDIVFSYDYTDASRDGVICRFDLINVRIEFLPNEQEEYDKLTRKAAIEIGRARVGKGSEPRLKRILQKRAAVSASASLRIPVAIRLLEEHRGIRTVIFHERIDGADRLVAALKQRLHRVVAYHSKIGPEIRRDNLRLYRSGMKDVLVSCRALDEGMNVPETQVAIVAASTASTRQRIQRLGRVLRPSVGKDSATVYTIYATNSEEKRLIDEATKISDVASVTWLNAGR